MPVQAGEPGFAQAATLIADSWKKKPDDLFSSAGNPPYPRVESEKPKVVRQGRHRLLVEHRLKYLPGLGQPFLEFIFRVSSAWKEPIHADGRKGGGYLFRLEVAYCSPGVKISGVAVGPWRAENLDLSSGSIWVPEPIAALFSPFAGPVSGRILVENMRRHERLDLPCLLRVIVPGPDPL
jgi:hypothetical protein